MINKKKNQVKVKIYHEIQHALSKHCMAAARAVDLADSPLYVAE